MKNNFMCENEQVKNYSTAVDVQRNKVMVYLQYNLPAVTYSL